MRIIHLCETCISQGSIYDLYYSFMISAIAWLLKKYVLFTDAETIDQLNSICEKAKNEAVLQFTMKTKRS